MQLRPTFIIKQDLLFIIKQELLFDTTCNKNSNHKINKLNRQLEYIVNRRIDIMSLNEGSISNSQLSGRLILQESYVQGLVQAQINSNQTKQGLSNTILANEQFHHKIASSYQNNQIKSIVINSQFSIDVIPQSFKNDSRIKAQNDSVNDESFNKSFSKSNKGRASSQSSSQNDLSFHLEDYLKQIQQKYFMLQLNQFDQLKINQIKQKIQTQILSLYQIFINKSSFSTECNILSDNEIQIAPMKVNNQSIISRKNHHGKLIKDKLIMLMQKYLQTWCSKSQGQSRQNTIKFIRKHINIQQVLQFDNLSEINQRTSYSVFLNSQIQREITQLEAFYPDKLQFLKQYYNDNDKKIYYYFKKSSRKYHHMNQQNSEITQNRIDDIFKLVLDSSCQQGLLSRKLNAFNKIITNQWKNVTNLYLEGPFFSNILFSRLIVNINNFSQLQQLCLSNTSNLQHIVILLSLQSLNKLKNFKKLIIRNYTNSIQTLIRNLLAQLSIIKQNQLNYEIIIDCTKIQKLNLSKNHFMKFTKFIQYSKNNKFSSLKELILKHNSIDDDMFQVLIINNSMFPQLKTLDLSYNKIKNIKYQLFDPIVKSNKSRSRKLGYLSILLFNNLLNNDSNTIRKSQFLEIMLIVLKLKMKQIQSINQKDQGKNCKQNQLVYSQQYFQDNLIKQMNQFFKSKKLCLQALNEVIQNINISRQIYKDNNFLMSSQSNVESLKQQKTNFEQLRLFSIFIKNQRNKVLLGLDSSIEQYNHKRINYQKNQQIFFKIGQLVYDIEELLKLSDFKNFQYKAPFNSTILFDSINNVITKIRILWQNQLFIENIQIQILIQYIIESNFILTQDKMPYKQKRIKYFLINQLKNFIQNQKQQFFSYSDQKNQKEYEFPIHHRIQFINQFHRFIIKLQLQVMFDKILRLQLRNTQQRLKQSSFKQVVNLLIKSLMQKYNSRNQIQSTFNKVKQSFLINKKSHKYLHLNDQFSIRQLSNDRKSNIKPSLDTLSNYNNQFNQKLKNKRLKQKYLVQSQFKRASFMHSLIFQDVKSNFQVKLIQNYNQICEFIKTQLFIKVEQLVKRKEYLVQNSIQSVYFQQKIIGYLIRKLKIVISDQIYPKPQCQFY